MKMMPPDVISHENQLQHLSEPSIFILDVFRTADRAGQIFIPHRPHSADNLFDLSIVGTPNTYCSCLGFGFCTYEHLLSQLLSNVLSIFTTYLPTARKQRRHY